MDVVVRGIKAIGWQKMFVEMFKNLEPNDKFIIKASRQKGKSTILCQGLLYYAINNKGSISYFISPTNNQCRKQFNDIKRGIEKSGLVKKMNESTCEIVFTNGSQINFRSAESGDNLRGNTVKGSALFIDEAAFIKDDTISLLLPYVTVNKCPIIMCSTPRKKRGTFYRYYSKALIGTKGYKYIDVNDFDNSYFITEEQIEDYRSIMTPEKFKNEILGLFSDDSEGVFGDYKSVFYEPEDKEPVYVGIDWSAEGIDSTIAVGFNRKFEMCMLWKDSGKRDLTDRLNELATLLNSHHNIRKIVVEKNSIGAVYASMLKRAYKGNGIIEEFVTTNDSKRDIIETLVAKIGKREITLLPDKELDYQFSIFESTQSATGKVVYKANENVQDSHDDIPLATAFAVRGFASGAGTYMIRGQRHK